MGGKIKNVKQFNLFIDFDNTLVNSTKQSVAMLNKKFNKNMDWRNLKRYDYKDLFKNISTNDVIELFEDEEFFNNVETYDDVKDVLFQVGNNYNISIVTCGNKNNLALKNKWLSENFKGLYDNYYYLNNVKLDKSGVNMKNGIHIDDHIDALRSSNAKIKILFKHDGIETNWNRHNPTEELYIVTSWRQISDILNFYIKQGEII